MEVWKYGSMGVWEYGSMGVWEKKILQSKRVEDENFSLRFDIPKCIISVKVQWGVNCNDEH
jgi:hypothetical protein